MPDVSSKDRLTGLSPFSWGMDADSLVASVRHFALARGICARREQLAPDWS